VDPEWQLVQNVAPIADFFFAFRASKIFSRAADKMDGRTKCG
jgi:hypothetical protein